MRAALDAGVAVDRGVWGELGAAGFFALRLPEADGGVGLGLPESVLLFEEAGRVLLPGPLVATHLAAGAVGAVKGAADGGAVVAVLDEGRPVAHLEAADALIALGPVRPGGRRGSWRGTPCGSSYGRRVPYGHSTRSRPCTV